MNQVLNILHLNVKDALAPSCQINTFILNILMGILHHQSTLKIFYLDKSAEYRIKAPAYKIYILSHIYIMDAENPIEIRQISDYCMACLHNL